MMKAFRIGMLGLTVVAFSAGSLVAETWEEVAKKIAEKSKAIKSMSYKTKMVMDVKDPNMTNKTESEGTYEYMIKDDQTTLYRMETKSKSEMKYQGGETKTNMTMVAVSDGEYIYNYSDTDGNKQATKEKYVREKVAPVDPTSGFKQMEQTYNVKVLPDATIDGRPTFVVEMTPKDEQMKAYVGKMVTNYCKETGLPLKMVQYNGKGEVQSTTTITDIKVNPTIAPDRFKFTPPAGVTVTDNTNRR